MMTDSLEAKEGWLSDLVKKHPNEVDAEAYSVVLQSIASCAQAGAPQRAEELANRMNVEPSDKCYQAVLEAWANSPREDASLCVVRAERWFVKIKEPTVESYHMLLNVLSKGRSKTNNRNRKKQILMDHAKKAEEILESMTLQPDTKAFNYVMRAWSHIRQDPELMATKVMEWLHRIEALQQENPAGTIQPNTRSYAMGMECYAVLAGHRVRSGTGDGLQEMQQVEAILKYMHDLNKEGHRDVVPNTVAYNILISAYARLSESHHHQDAPLKAERVLRRMMAIGKDAAPDHLSFTKVIQAWSNAKRQTSGQRAAYWLDKLWELYEEKNHDERLHPKIFTYNMVIKAGKGDPEKAEKVFMQLLRAEKADSEAFLRPNSASFGLIIHSWSKKDLPRAVMWLEELMQRESTNNGSTTDITTTPELFQAILKHAAMDPSLDNLILGLKVFDYYRSSRHAVDVNTFAWLLKLGLKAYSEPQHNVDRKEFVADIIQDCRDDGLVSNVFLRELANGPIYYGGWTAKESKATVQEFFADWPIPASWTRNVHHHNLPQKSDTIRKSREGAKSFRSVDDASE